MILYMVRGYNIKEVESERQTEHSVFINGNRNAWKSQWTQFYKTRQEAKCAILNSLNKSLNTYEKYIENIKMKIEQVEDL